MGQRKGAYRILMWKTQGKRPLGRTRRKWEDNSKIDIQKVGWEHGLDYLAQDRDRWRALVKPTMDLRVP